MKVKERPILFSGPMVRAILEGRKSQTRRIVKPQPERLQVYDATVRDGVCQFYGVGRSSQFADSLDVQCPCGVPGDRLWVRETWQHTVATDSDCCVCYAADLSSRHSLADQCGQGDFVAVGEQCEPLHVGKWRPSIHMPRWASRITLEVVGVRVERLQDISEADAVSEGVDFISVGGVGAKDVFESLWESINGEGSWHANPWVWAIEFGRVKP